MFIFISAELVVSIMSYMQSRTLLPQQKWQSTFTSQAITISIVVAPPHIEHGHFNIVKGTAQRFLRVGLH
jgi:hypothetical protein